MRNLRVYTNNNTEEVRGASVSELKLREFDRADRDLRNFIAENDTLMASFFDYVDTYNTAVLDMRNEIRTSSGDDPREMGKFKRGKKPVYVSYEPAKVNQETLVKLAGAGAVKFDTKTFDKCIVRGVIGADEVSDSRKAEPGSFRVTGPKTIEFNL